MQIRFSQMPAVVQVLDVCVEKNGRSLNGDLSWFNPRFLTKESSLVKLYTLIEGRNADDVGEDDKHYDSDCCGRCKAVNCGQVEATNKILLKWWCREMPWLNSVVQASQNWFLNKNHESVFLFRRLDSLPLLHTRHWFVTFCRLTSGDVTRCRALNQWKRTRSKRWSS